MLSLLTLLLSPLLASKVSFLITDTSRESDGYTQHWSNDNCVIVFDEGYTHLTRMKNEEWFNIDGLDIKMTQPEQALSDCSLSGILKHRIDILKDKGEVDSIYETPASSIYETPASSIYETPASFINQHTTAKDEGILVDGKDRKSMKNNGLLNCNLVSKGIYVVNSHIISFEGLKVRVLSVDPIRDCDDTIITRARSLVADYASNFKIVFPMFYKSKKMATCKFNLVLEESSTSLGLDNNEYPAPSVLEAPEMDLRGCVDYASKIKRDLPRLKSMRDSSRNLSESVTKIITEGRKSTSCPKSYEDEVNIRTKSSSLEAFNLEDRIRLRYFYEFQDISLTTPVQIYRSRTRCLGVSFQDSVEQFFHKLDQIHLLSDKKCGTFFKEIVLNGSEEFYAVDNSNFEQVLDGITQTIKVNNKDNANRTSCFHKLHEILNVKNSLRKVHKRN